MAVANRRYLIAPIENIVGSQLPSEEEVLGLLMYQIEVKNKICTGGSQWRHEHCCGAVVEGQDPIPA